MFFKNIIDGADLGNIRKKFRDKKIVLGTGCFDLLHVGHIYFLDMCRKQGDMLVIGINSDKAVSNMKGNTRPIVNQNERAIIISYFKYVDFVFVCDSIFADESIIQLKPDVFAIGEQSVDTFHSEVEAAKDVGSSIYVVKRIPFLSTTSIITSIVNSKDK